jgi:hypothetical protein
MTTMMRVNMLMVGRFLAQEVYLADWPSGAHAPAARGLAVRGNCTCGAFCGVRFLWSLTSVYVGLPRHRLMALRSDRLRQG